MNLTITIIEHFNGNESFWKCSPTFFCMEERAKRHEEVIKNEYKGIKTIFGGFNIPGLKTAQATLFEFEKSVLLTPHLAQFKKDITQVLNYLT